MQDKENKLKIFSNIVFDENVVIVKTECQKASFQVKTFLFFINFFKLGFLS